MVKALGVSRGARYVTKREISRIAVLQNHIEEGYVMKYHRVWAVLVIGLVVGAGSWYGGWAQGEAEQAANTGSEGRFERFFRSFEPGQMKYQEMTVGKEMGARIHERLEIGDGTGWSFLGGQWTENGELLGYHDRFVGEEIIRPPYKIWVDGRYQLSETDDRNPPGRAFYIAEGYTDLTAEFEFNADYRELGHGSAGLILRAADAGHFYLVYFPWGGQQMRAKHFWAIIAKVEGDGYVRNLKAVWVPGVPSEVDRWYKVRVEAQGPQISVWVDGRFALSVTDEAYKSGCVGLAGHGWYFFRNVRIGGTPVVPPAWSDETQLQADTFAVGLSSRSMPTGCVAPNGDVLLAGSGQMVRSQDKGRTWSEPVELPLGLQPLGDYSDTLFCTSDGRLIVMKYRARAEHHPLVPAISISESTDSGYTWLHADTDTYLTHIGGKVAAEGWPELPATLHPYGPLVETEDGTLLRFLYGSAKDEDATFTDIHSWGSAHCKAYAVRSTDAGVSWSPVELDWPMWSGAEQRGQAPGSLDFTEPTGVAIGNAVTVLIRPIYSPMMWQCWSYDGGASWDAAVRATFPGYAQSMIRTSSGAILCAHRFPHYSINVSYDDGVNWDAGTVIDYSAWAMGCMVEVEPDVVLCTYMNSDGEHKGPLLAQLIRVTPDGIYPVERQATEQ